MPQKGIFAPGQIVWEASAERKKNSRMYRFASYLRTLFPQAKYNFFVYDELHRFSVSEPASFWQACAEFTGLIWQQKPRSIYRCPSGKMLDAEWFKGGKLNYAQNLLVAKDSDVIAVYSFIEGQESPASTFSYRELYVLVTRCAAALRRLGVRKGDVVCGVLANTVEAVVAALATAAIGGIWASCSPDFGRQGIEDRLRQINPGVIFFTTEYIYARKLYDCLPKMSKVLAKFSASTAVAVQHLDIKDYSRDYLTFAEFIARGDTEEELIFAEMDFASDPLFILFSSGTTGPPKCIVHSTGGTLLQHQKELHIHGDLGHGDCLMFYTTCGWMMWNWMLSALSVGCAIGLYEGAPHVPCSAALWQVAAKIKATALGLSPRYLDVCMRNYTATDYPTDNLRTIFSTGSALSSEHYRFIYQTLQKDVHLASISGGTDIISCFMLGNVLLPVRVGEIQARGLGMDVHAFNTQGKRVVAEQGELVCTKPFVSMPIGFWHDQDACRFKAAYFDFFPQVWRHGDLIAITSHGGVRMYGRSDAVLNPHGIRIGTTEIYRQLERIKNVLDAIIIDHNHVLILFVKLAENIELDDDLKTEIKKEIAAGLTRRHVPRHIFQVKDLPCTMNGKKMELVVKKIFAGEDIPEQSTIANPDALTCFFKAKQAYATM